MNKAPDLTQQKNAKRLSESEQAKLPPGAIWTDQSLTRGDGGELRWLHNPDSDLAQEAIKRCRSRHSAFPELTFSNSLFFVSRMVASSKARLDVSTWHAGCVTYQMRQQRPRICQVMYVVMRDAN